MRPPPEPRRSCCSTRASRGAPTSSTARWAAPNAAIPTVDTSFALGSELANGVTDGHTGVGVHIETTTHSEVRSTRNVIAETPTGDPDNVVMAGAHLDSVIDGPGINDNGSGSAALVEIARQISRLGIDPDAQAALRLVERRGGGPDRLDRVRPEPERGRGRDIALYLNFDMIGSPNFARLIFDGNGSAFGTPGPRARTRSSALRALLRRRRPGQRPDAFDGRSDYGPFIAVGIPAGGLFTGAEGVKTEAEQAAYGGTAGEAFDPCYHQACDDIDNISVEGLNQMSDAVAHADQPLRLQPQLHPAADGLGEAGSAKTAQGKYLGTRCASSGPAETIPRIERPARRRGARRLAGSDTLPGDG